MESRIKQRFNDFILAEARRRYNIAASNLHLLDGTDKDTTNI
ncbi:hypothetical protein U14_04917 [Candidatus Moduliflexus flocculans]|uniref:Uncharacterized protein n=1 Tax=Candidatus Moduliflexus flocculans TaxID=1499966 RepID=A0A0S6W519_9BACT|nr:hypothetical protein U14_04917 [Candidatus Moduliflexus flocculans]